ncbi:hypothetical protein [Streptomyces sp. WMMB303]|nr:hypothetical protein [Streptomyces sp. WMMB303]MDF4254667.1 hypothetical protein [Streptomyces sp. WMMB303]MDF4254704.1 hypothetical protein [Streptomyces sp. WMMB303]
MHDSDFASGPQARPEHTHRLYHFLVALCGEEDPLPALAVSWTGHLR